MSVSHLHEPAAHHRLAALPRLGVGVLFNPSLTSFAREHRDAMDYMAIIPDRYWLDEGPGDPRRFEDLEGFTSTFEHVGERIPLVGHSVGMSIGSAEWFDEAHVDALARWRERFDMPWHSDHLSFIRMPGVDAHTPLSAGLAVPVPYDREVLELVAERMELVQRKIPVPFLLENNVYYVDLPEQEMTEPEFMNALMHRTGGGILLDVHNVVVNATNHGFDAREFIFALDLRHVVELHIAGGSEVAGMYADSHAGPVAESVWELLDDVVANTPNLCGITFEFEETYFPRLGNEGVLGELRRARAVWDRHH